MFGPLIKRLSASILGQRQTCQATITSTAMVDPLEPRCLLSTMQAVMLAEPVASPTALVANNAPADSHATVLAAKAARAKPPKITYSGPIVITRGGVYSGNWQSLDANVPAVQIRTSQPVTIENSYIRSRSSCIDASGFAPSITVRNTYGYGLNPNVAGRNPGRFLDVDGFKNLVATNNYMENTSGIYVYSYQGNHTAKQTVKVLRNVAKNIDGRTSNGKGGWATGEPNPDYYRQFVQINGVTNLAGAEIAWNQIINLPGQSRVEENINIHATTGKPKSPVLVHDNYIQGAYPSDAQDAKVYTGGGIMLSDNGSSYIRAYNNQIIGTGHIGLTISSGHDNAVYNNRIVSNGRLPNGTVMSYSNVGVVIWNFNNERTFTNNSGYNNLITWINGKGVQNDQWIPDATKWTNNRPWPSAVNGQTQAAEWSYWQNKLANAHITVGPKS